MTRSRSLRVVAATLALALTAPALAESPVAELPAGWVLQKLAATDGEILRPEHWSYQEEPTPSGVMWTLAEDRKPDGTYLTGMRIQLASFSAEQRASKTPAQLADELYAKFRSDAERVVDTCGPELRGDFTNRCIEVVQRIPNLSAEDPFHIAYGLWWSETLFVVSIFGTPEREWPERAPTHQAMANFRLIGPNFGKNSSAPSQGGAADATAGSTDANDAEADPLP